MRIGDWLKGINCRVVQGDIDTQVEEVVYDSRQACADSVFVCIKGSNTDSHDFIPDVIEAGCRVIVAEHPVKVPDGVTLIVVDDGREALALLSSARFGYPSTKLTTIGITGTKGKTTTSYMVKAALEATGKKVGLIGTNGAVIDGVRYSTNNTTPESYIIQQYLAMMVDAGCECAVMEVSSQALMMRRVAGIFFDYGLFTNLSPDHIGENEHRNFDDYLYWKSRLLTICRTGAINIETEDFKKVTADATCHLFTYGFRDKKEVDFAGSGITYTSNSDFVGVEFDVSGQLESHVKVGMPGKFNAQNALAALSVCSLLFMDEGNLTDEICRQMAASLENIRVDGRMEIAYSSDKFSVLIDYAHNSVSMENLLDTLRDYNPKRLICVFGCGGNRSRERRYSMGEIAGREADLCVITADNPRFEKNEDIIEDIIVGVCKTGGRFKVIPDRRQAITWAIKNAEKGDMIAVLGKGHEDYQEIEGVRHHFSDREVVEDVIRELEGA